MKPFAFIVAGILFASSMALGQVSDGLAGQLQPAEPPPRMTMEKAFAPKRAKAEERPTAIVVRYRSTKNGKIIRSLPSGISGVFEPQPDPSEQRIGFLATPKFEDVERALSAFRREPDVLSAEVIYVSETVSEALVAFEEREQTTRLIVKEKPLYAKRLSPDPQERARLMTAAMSAVAGIDLEYVRDLWDGSRVLRLPNPVSIRRAKAIARTLVEAGLAEYAEPDTPMYPAAVPNDPMFSQQWHYAAPSSSNLGGANLPAAWDVTTGSSSIVVAVLDTGIDTLHPEFAGRVVAGYDFVSGISSAGDGQARDSDPSDPGDFCALNATPSNWHGTHVAGTIGAATNNGIGVAGVAPNVKIQPVRVLGRCGGSTSDIADAITWAAGGGVAGVPLNATPAKVINLSVGALGTCSATYQNAIDFALSQGATVVVAAGNDAIPASQFNPASCLGVVAVHAHTKFGDYASYSNYGSAISISGPGGQQQNSAPWGADGGVLSTSNTGITTPLSSSYTFLQGTSMAAPHVSGVAALVASLFPSYSAAVIKDVLRSSSRPFPLQSYCWLDGGCGPGILDAATAVMDRVHFYLLFEGAGSVVSNPAGILCSTDCAYTAPYGSATYVLTATPAPGYVFIGWVGACSGTSICEYVPSGAKIIGARFALAGGQFPLSVSKSGNGFGTLSSTPGGINCGSTCSYSFGGGATVAVYAVPQSTSSFSGWSGACAGTGNPCIVAMTASKSLVANFVWMDDYPDSYAAAATVQPTSATQGSLFNGTDQDWFRISFPAKGRWMIGTSGTTDTVGEVYGPDGVTLYGTNDDFAPPANLNFGMAFIVPSAQTVLVRVTGYRDAVVQTTGPYTLLSTFVPTQTLSVTRLGNGSGTVTSSPAGIDCGSTCSEEFDANSSVTLNVAVSAGSAFAGWSGACSGTGACVVSMNAAKSVNATFVSAVTTPRLGNISTRMQVLTGNDVMIGGFIIGGASTKTIVVRARGPSLIPYGITNALSNPMLQLVRSSDQVTIAANDDWGSAVNAGAIAASGFAPANPLEAAILMTLQPGAYTAIVTGAGGGTGVGIVEVFEVDHPEVPLINISTRGQVLTGNDVMIGGFVIQGSGAQTVVVRARGPSLIPYGITNALSNPSLQLVRSSDQTTIAVNDNWGSAANATALSASGFAPANSLEAAILITLDPGAYTAIVTGAGGGTGVGIIEVFAQ
jgi:subtilisin family serine protease